MTNKAKLMRIITHNQKLKYYWNCGEHLIIFQGSREHAAEFLGTGELDESEFQGTS